MTLEFPSVSILFPHLSHRASSSSTVCLLPRTAAGAWSTCTIRTPRRTKRRWSCPRRITATPISTTPSRTTRYPVAPSPHITTISTPPHPLQRPPPHLITTRSVSRMAIFDFLHENWMCKCSDVCKLPPLQSSQCVVVGRCGAKSYLIPTVAKTLHPHVCSNILTDDDSTIVYIGVRWWAFHVCQRNLTTLWYTLGSCRHTHQISVIVDTPTGMMSSNKAQVFILDIFHQFKYQFKPIFFMLRL